MIWFENFFDRAARFDRNDDESVGHQKVLKTSLGLEFTHLMTILRRTCSTKQYKMLVITTKFVKISSNQIFLCPTSNIVQ
jgi:hypothetical protein